MKVKNKNKESAIKPNLRQSEISITFFKLFPVLPVFPVVRTFFKTFQ